MSRHPLPDFSAVEWAEYSTVGITYQVARYAFDRECKLLRVCFAGNYGYGSAGNGDAAYMDAMYRAAVEVIGPDGLILDFTDLNYEWGDLLGRVLNPPDRWAQLESPPFALVLGQGCEQGLRSLLLEDLGWSDSELGWVFHGVADAQRYVGEVMRKRASAVRQQYEADKAARALAFWELLGSEVEPEQCKQSGCHRLRVKDSVLCRIHHYEKIQHEACPFK